MTDVGRTARILVIDDEPTVCKSCEKILARDGYEVATAASGHEGLVRLGGEPFDIVITDLKMADVGGDAVLEALRTSLPDVVAVVITGYATISSVVETMKLGAFDYLPKPFTPEEMSTVIARAWEKRKAILEAKAMAAREMPPAMVGIVGKSERVQEVYQLIRRVAPTSSIVLVVGETGTGKEPVARAIHALSPRREAPFVAVDCAAVGAELLERELFGQVGGAPGGAGGDAPGVFTAADGGTVFLDEICNLSLEIQAKLLRFIEGCEVVPIGGVEPRRADVRLVFATNRDLKRMVAEGAFREDLYYRLHVFPIVLPLLRDRREDVPMLAANLLANVRAATGKAVTTIAEPALRLLEEYDWPGNIDQLDSVLQRAVLACQGEVIEPHHLPEVLTRAAPPNSLPVPRTNQEFLALKKKLREQAVAELEREFLLQALERNAWNVTRAALEVGIQRPNFQALMRKHGLRASHAPEPPQAG
ncbi:MAG TPA: sigma-54 dependent transcriptional regulator [Polyangia bacterium]|jgi:two-component system NtrC family response regulator